VEYLKMAVEMDFYDIIISMKSSNIRVMVQAYRYLAMRLDEEGMDFPFHLGVTEAGNGEDGIIKSAAGNGALLYDGIGDTIRVSLTDEPENEIPVARYIVDYAATFSPHPPVPPVMSSVFNPFEFRKRKSRTAGIFGGKNVPKTAGHDFFVSGDNIIIDGEKYKITGGREFDKNTPYPVIYLMKEWYDYRTGKVEKRDETTELGGTMRLGAYPCRLKKGSKAWEAYQKDEIFERHRHRYEFNNEYRESIEKAGLKVVGTSPDEELVEIVELEDHPWFIGVQIHPEFKSRPMDPHPLFKAFIKASCEFKKEKK
jgi:4-hydroxy-3-methylbut-2-en-1-yl diphosphate synthase IspG/GcpE